MRTDSSSPDLKLSSPHMYNMELLNGGHVGNQPAFPGQAYNSGNNKYTLEQVDPSTLEDDSDDDEYTTVKGLRPGKKTKGRVKIKMEFIENKLRRYTTFSKRKTGIMKKAYELSTLTGTQVMLLVASETGHVYTFATRKLQPMITSESGKALIQTCLNSPDPPPVAPGQQQAVEQRMNPGGFEETELTYAVDEENGKPILVDGSSGLKPVYTMSSSPILQEGSPGSQQAQSQQQLHHQQQTYQSISSVPMATVVQQTQASNGVPVSTVKTSTAGSISVHLPGLPPGFILQPGTSFAIPVQSSPQQTTQVVSSQSQQQAVYRIPAPSQQSTQLIQADATQRIPLQANGSNAAGATVNVISTGTPQGATALTPSVFMYQTPQGFVYAPATGPLPDKTVFNFTQPATALSGAQIETGQQQGQVQQQQQQQTQQQIITIPMPVSLAGSSQMFQLTTSEGTQLTDLSQPSPAKKSRKP